MLNPIKIAIFYHARISGGAHAATIPNDNRVNFPANPPIDPVHARKVMTEQINTLFNSKLLDAANEFIIGLNGTHDDYMFTKSLCGEANIVLHGAHSASELPTMAMVDAFARSHPGWVIFYHHSKGVCWPGPNGEMRQRWRRCLERNTIWNWPDCIQDIQRGFDMVGAHWLTAAKYPDSAPALPHPIWGGNFFWTTADYLKTLKPLQSDHSWRERYQAEMWPTSGKPRHVRDYAPHWPGIDACGNGAK